MSDHIEKMRWAIVLNPVMKPTDGYKAATAAFDALMDAVPDLVWGGDFASSPAGRYCIDVGAVHGGHYAVCGLWASTRRKTRKEAKAAANTHHRAQVRKIWEGV